MKHRGREAAEAEIELPLSGRVVATAYGAIAPRLRQLGERGPARIRESEASRFVEGFARSVVLRVSKPITTDARRRTTAVPAGHEQRNKRKAGFSSANSGDKCPSR